MMIDGVNLTLINEFINLTKLQDMKYLKTNMVERIVLTLLLSMCTFVAAQAATISGTVVSSQDDNPIIGATVTIDGTTIGTATDLDGKFTIQNAPNSGIVTFSYLGCEPQSLAIADGQIYNIALSSDVQQIDEVVVVGYGTMRKADLTGSIRSVTGEAIESRKNLQVASSLQGAMSGVTVTNSSTTLGGSSDILIRGVTTISDSSPLIIVDGVSVADINQVSPSDIETLTVLKDAASASIYGSRAASGVILITTKRAKAGSVNVNYSYEISVDQAVKQAERQSAVEYMQAFNELKWNDLGNGDNNQYSQYSQELIENYAQLHAEDPDAYPDTDWTSMIFKDHAIRQTHNVSISAGSEHVRSNISLRYDDAEGLLDNYTYERITARTNNDFTINKVFSASLDMSLVRTNTITPASNPIPGWNYAPAVYAAVWSDGRLGEGKSGTNPYAQMVAGGTSTYKDNNVSGKASLDITPLEGLKLSAILSPSFNFDKSKQFIKEISIYDAYDPTLFVTTVQGNTSTYLEENREEDYSITTQFLANYNKSFKNNSNLSAMAGYENYYYNNESLMASRDQYVLQNYPYLDLGPETYRDNSGSAYETAYRSVFARAVYSYDNRYMIQGNLRYDGSSRFHKDYRWALFPSVSAGWTISEENFMQNQDVASFMKLRLSYGTLGNERIGNYPYQATMSYDSALLYSGTTVTSAQTAAQSSYAIEDITWETTSSFNIGLDVNFLDNRLGVTGEYYFKKTTDMLLSVEIPTYMGYGNPEQNSGDMSTKGYDIDLSWRDMVGDFSYSITANLSQYNSVMGNLDDTQVISSNKIIVEGSGYYEWYGYVADGIFQTQEEVDNSAVLTSSTAPGDIKYKDISGPDGVPDGVISSEYDRVLLGSSQPQFMYGLNMQFAYKNFDLGVALQGVGKQNTNLITQLQPNMANWGQFPTEIMTSYWSNYNTAEENATAKYPRLTETNKSSNYEMSSFWLFNGGYLRVKNITVGYTLPSKITDKLSIKSLRVYVSGNNLLCFDQYPDGYDPELMATEQYDETIITGYPVTSSIITGISLAF